ncbi:unnamed protein product [Coffea canephora]|uniref:Legumain prodomain domain-containing protein n=1 Tax=Coffea canephora TaxID=49390 RepID=A0A068UQL5_COFCA|nr:unnamed protein product [Coffea canephora]
MAVHRIAFGVMWLVLLQLITLPFVSMSIRSRATGGPFGHRVWDPLIRSPVDDPGKPEAEENEGIRWAILVAGSNGFANYRHQSDICHAYQILKRGGLKDENIVVFMYDDIANNKLNPRPGIIINRPDGDDVYAGVPKDYTGKAVSPENLFAVILGDKSAVKGGNGKVVNSSSNDRIFIYYSDHGGPGILGMPQNTYLYGKDFVEVLKKKHASGTYKEMVIYVEACESGSFFEGLMPENLNIYVTTASNAEESSYATYCPDMDPSPPEHFPCLGDLYSVAWMEDSESHNLKRETIVQQYKKVKERTSNHHTYDAGSHVMEYGNKSIHAEKLYLYQGFDPATENYPANQIDIHPRMDVVNQRSADLVFMWDRYKKMEDGSAEKGELLKQITDTMLHRNHLDGSMDIIGAFLFGPERGSAVLNHVRHGGLPIVDDWDCLKSSVRIFETHCGSLTQYGMKHMRAFANICNRGVSRAALEEACEAACTGHDLGQWDPAKRGFSA